MKENKCNCRSIYQSVQSTISTMMIGQVPSNFLPSRKLRTFTKVLEYTSWDTVLPTCCCHTRLKWTHILLFTMMLCSVIQNQLCYSNTSVSCEREKPKPGHAASEGRSELLCGCRSKIQEIHKRSLSKGSSMINLPPSTLMHEVISSWKSLSCQHNHKHMCEVVSINNKFLKNLATAPPYKKSQKT